MQGKVSSLQQYSMASGETGINQLSTFPNKDRVAESSLESFLVY